MVRRARTLLLGAAVIGIALVLLARSREEPAPTMPATPAQEVSPLGETAAGGEREVRLALGPGPHGLDSGGTLVLESQALAEMTSLSLDLRMPADAVGTEPPPVRVVAPDGRLLHAEGSIGANPGSVGLALDTAWLLPGRYVIEVKTVERSHFPLRRYALEVR